MLKVTRLKSQIIEVFFYFYQIPITVNMLKICQRLHTTIEKDLLFMFHKLVFHQSECRKGLGL